MAKDHFIRCDHWQLQASPIVRKSASDTIAEYRRLTNALCTVFLTHWPSVVNHRVQDLERLFHPTADNPTTPYGAWFQKQFPRFPSYLRRAATQAAFGAVSSFMNRYRTWQGSERVMRTARPPAWGGFRGYPVMYAANEGAGAMIRLKYDHVQIKLYSATSRAWSWHNVCVVKRGARDAHGFAMRSPTLILKGTKLSLAQPLDIPNQWAKNQAQQNLIALGKAVNHHSHLNRELVCAVDLGINTQATCSIISPAGSVIARIFINARGVHKARQDRCVSKIQQCAKKTMGGIPLRSMDEGNRDKGSTTAGKLHRGFCANTYARMRNLNTEISREAARKILAFARKYGAMTVVFEDLKGFRPRGQRPNLRQRFHTWLHRKLVRQVESSAQERGMKVAFVYARGTSAWAYDGSGKVKRDADNYAQCTFTTGKRYNADLNASYNIGARYFWRKLPKSIRSKVQAQEFATPTADSPIHASNAFTRPSRNGRASGSGKSSRPLQRTPVTLSSLWASSSLVVAGS